VDALTIAVRLSPRSGREEVAGVTEAGELHIRVRPAPVDGAANGAAVRLIAAALGVAPSAIELVSGASSRHKRVRIAGVDATIVRRRWPGVAISGSG
jgi:uncharacterized protein (TIGR00251 family)